ncbi:MAG: hypothetical protein K2I79_03200, partial [Clostridia bacterium]|nr:hypothetical protein [Clostridia bacterium]
DEVLFGLSNKIWSIMAFALVGACVLMFIIMLLTRHGWKKAELAKEQAIEDDARRKEEAEAAKQAAKEEAEQAKRAAWEEEEREERRRRMHWEEEEREFRRRDNDSREK